MYFIVLLAFLMPATVWGQDVESASGTGIEEIVVTARKRAEMIEDTPISVTALSAERLREADVTRLTDVQQLVPNLQIQGSASGNSASSQFRLRGVGTTRAGGSFDPGVGVYLDGIYLPGNFTSILNLVDVQQIEVLRGPQGTLFGKNTVGGAVTVRTAKPTDEFEGSLLVRPGNYDSVDTRAMLNIPIVDDLAMRFSLATSNADGFHRNTLRHVDLGGTETIGVLGSLRWQATDAITVDLSGQWNRNRVDGGADRCVVASGAEGRSIGPPGFLDACRRSRPFRGQHDAHELADSMNWGAWGVVDWDLSDFAPFDDFYLKSITSWRKSQTRLRADIDATELPAVRIAVIGPEQEDGSTATGQNIMQELQLGGVAFDDRLKFIAGVFGFWEETRAPQVTELSIFGRPDGGLTETKTDNWDWALFSQATADVTDWLSITGGVRYTQEKKGADLTGIILFPDEDPPVLASEREVFDAWTPMASIALTMPDDWMGDAPIDHLMTYFTYARGFRGGGFNSAPNANEDRLLEEFDPEHVDSFELGVKSLAFDDRLSVTLAAFHYDYEDIQVLTTEPTAGGIPDQPIRNAGEATGQGIELEMRAMPLPGLLLTGSLGYIDTEYDEYDSVDELTGLPRDRAGESFNNTPELQTNVAIQFSLPIELGSITSLYGTLTPRLQWYYQSDEHYIGPEVVEARQRGYNLLNARLTYTFMDDRAQIALWGRNLTDQEYFSNLTGLASTYGVVVRNYNAPLTYGGELSYRFN